MSWGTADRAAAAASDSISIVICIKFQRDPKLQSLVSARRRARHQGGGRGMGGMRAGFPRPVPAAEAFTSQVAHWAPRWPFGHGT